MRKLILLPCLLLPLALQAQKKPLDHSVYDSWQSVSATSLSPKGNVLTYEVNPQEGDGTLYIQVMGKKGRQIAIERGYQARVLDNEAYAVCLIKPQYAKTRRAKIDKKKADDMPKDSLAVIDLRTGKVTRFPNVKGFKMGKHALEAFAFATTDTSFVLDRKAKDMGQPLAIYHFADARIDTLQQIDKYEFSKDGKQLGLVRKTGKKGFVTGFYSLEGGARFFTDTVTWHAVPRFDEEGKAALYLVARDTVSSGSKHAELYGYTVGAEQPRKMAGPEGLGTLPEGWGLTENSSYSFSHNGQRVHVGVQELTPPKDTNLVSFELPGLDIWNWNAAELPPSQKVNKEADAARTYPVRLGEGTPKLLNSSKLVRYSMGNRGDGPWDLRVTTVNPVERQWNYQYEMDVEVVSANETRQIAHGQLEGVSLSPLAKHVIWWDYNTQSWYLYNLDQNRTLALAPDVVFWTEDDDHPMKKEPYGAAGWTRDDEAVLLYDRYDIWKVPADGSAPVRLTEGRENGITYRYINTKDQEEERHVLPEETILLSVFDNATKENGLASLQVGNPAKSFKTLVKGGYSWSSVKKAKDANVFTYLKGNFQDPMDVYYTTVLGKSEQKLSAINPQKDQYNWGTAEPRWTDCCTSPKTLTPPRSTP